MNALVSITIAVPALQERIEAWTRDAERAFSPNTWRAWRTDWMSFLCWCESTGSSSMPADPQTIAAYLLAESAAGRAVATIRRRAASIARVHRAAEIPNPCDTEKVRTAFRTIARERGTDQHQAAPLCSREAEKIAAHVAALGPSRKNLRDLALMLVGRDLLARASELVSITVESITWEDEGTAQIALRRHKTSTDTVLYLIGVDATAALKRWLEASGIATGPVFRSLRRGHQLADRALTPCDVTRILKGLARAARLKPDFSSHSLRVGMAQDLTAANVEGAAIMQAAGWRTPRMLARYTERLAARRGAIARYYLQLRR